MKYSWKFWLDVLWLAALAVYVIVGMPLASFHGDEAMQIYMSEDYARAFIDRDSLGLMVGPPYYIDTPPQLRILNGSVNRHVIGFSWHLAGFTTGDLPPVPGWDWGLDYQTNVDTGHRPSDGLMLAARASSTLFLALSTAVVFAIGGQLGSRPLAYLASALYTVNPIILLNGRRAMMEGSMLLFGLLTVLLAIIISRKQGRLWGWWLGLTLGAGMALASKHNSVVFVVGAYGWILIAAVVRRRWPDLFRLTVSGVLLLALFVVLSPALWNDPLARLQDLVTVRAELLDIQVLAEPLAPLPFAGRVTQIITQPFIQPLAHYEVASWAGYDPITHEIARYMASPLSGFQAGPLIGGLLTLLAGLGFVILMIPRWRPACLTWAQALGMLPWLLVTVAFALVNPLPWQRYYLVLIPIYTLLAALSIQGIIRQLVRMRP